MQPNGFARPYTVATQTDDLDEARAVCGEHLYPRSMRLLHRGARIDARFAFMRLGVTTLADVRYGAAVTGRTGELGSYHVNLVLSGHFHAEQDGRPIDGTPGRGAVYRPAGETALHYASADCRLLGLRIDRSALETHLATVHDVRVKGAVRFAGQLPAASQGGHTCANLIRFMAAEMNNTRSLFHEPMVLAPWEEAIMTALLLSTDHQYREQLESEPSARYAPRSIIAAVDAVHAEPRRVFTVALLAEIAGIGGRQLCAEFWRRFAMTPMTYVRHVRMLAAHAELLHADPDQTSVAAVAHRWGLTPLGQFTTLYQARFHTTPTATLHQRRTS